MHPILLKLGSFTIYSYGVMAALGFGLATLLIYRQSSRFSVDKEKMIDLAILILITGISGARALYVLINIGYYIPRPFEIFNLSKGGLVWYGGFLTALVFTVLYLRKNKLNFWNVTDLIAPYIALAQSLGRIGCFLNGCCYGLEAPAGYMFSVRFPCESVSRYPTQIYSALALFFIFAVLRIWQGRRHFTGEIFLGYCALYSLKRFLMEFLRGDNPRMAYGLTMSQSISIVIFIVSAAILTYKVMEWKKKNSNSM